MTDRCRWLITLPLLVLAGCLALGKSAPSHFYLLAAPPEPTAAAPAAIQGFLLLPTVALPAYLDRPQLVTRSRAQELHIAPFERWGEPLADGLTRVLGEILRRRLPAVAVGAGTDAAVPPTAWRCRSASTASRG